MEERLGNPRLLTCAGLAWLPAWCSHCCLSTTVHCGETNYWNPHDTALYCINCFC